MHNQVEIQKKINLNKDLNTTFNFSAKSNIQEQMVLKIKKGIEVYQTVSELQKQQKIMLS